MKHARNLLNRELESQRTQWGLEHDIQNHGSCGLVEAAQIICSQNQPSTDGYEGNEWFFELWNKHRDNPTRRIAIAAAMLMSAIECSVYERGLDKD